MEGTVRVWHVRNGWLLHTLHGESHTHALAFALDGRRLAAGAKDGTLCLWDSTCGRLISTFASVDSAPAAIALLLRERAHAHYVRPLLCVLCSRTRAVALSLRTRDAWERLQADSAARPEDTQPLALDPDFAAKRLHTHFAGGARCLWDVGGTLGGPAPRGPARLLSTARCTKRPVYVAIATVSPLTVTRSARWLLGTQHIRRSPRKIHPRCSAYAAGAGGGTGTSGADFEMALVGE